MVKLLNKLIKKCSIYSHSFCSSVYTLTFPLYQRIHHDIDQQLYHISLNSQHLQPKIIKYRMNYKLIKNGSNQIIKRIKRIIRLIQSKLDSSKLKKTKNNIEWNLKLMDDNNQNKIVSTDPLNKCQNNLYPITISTMY